jgi:hypothetical protein
VKERLLRDVRVGSTDDPDPHGKGKAAKGDGACSQRNHLADAVPGGCSQGCSGPHRVTALIHRRGGEDNEAHSEAQKGELHNP